MKKAEQQRPPTSSFSLTHKNTEGNRDEREERTVRFIEDMKRYSCYTLNSIQCGILTGTGSDLYVHFRQWKIGHSVICKLNVQFNRAVH